LWQPQPIQLLRADSQPVSASAPVMNPNTGRGWVPLQGNLLTFEPDTDNEETVEIDLSSGSPKAAFQRSHPAGCAVINRGNPGPWTQYDPRKDSAVVPYSIVFQ
jgi:hypothetical protein